MEIDTPFTMSQYNAQDPSLMSQYLRFHIATEKALACIDMCPVLGRRSQVPFHQLNSTSVEGKAT